jgi:hypothetical protein
MNKEEMKYNSRRVCECDYRFTCRVCLETAPPCFYTLDSGARVYGKAAVDMANTCPRSGNIRTPSR